MEKVNDPPTLHLMPTGGLCARFRVLVGAAAYCDATGKRLAVHWPAYNPTDKSGQIPFPVRMSELWDHPYEECNDAKRWYPKDWSVLDEPGDVRVRVTRLSPFVPYMRRPISSYLRRFPLTWIVQAAVRSVVVDLVHPTVGVIIRWNDRNNPKDTPDMFVTRMTEIIQVCPDVHFYLAADCIEVDELIHKTFPDRVTALKHGTDYKYDRRGIVRTLADLHIVTSCDWVVGTRRSSYAQMAALLRGAELLRSVAFGGSVKGGRYEATDNLAPKGEMLKALGCANQAS